MLGEAADLVPQGWQEGYFGALRDVSGGSRGAGPEKVPDLLMVQDAVVAHLRACREQASTPEERFLRAYSEIYHGCNEAENREVCAALDPQTLVQLSIALKKHEILHWLASQPSSRAPQPSPLLVPRRLGLTPLLRASATTDPRHLRSELLLAAGAVHGDPELTSLMYAAHRGDMECLGLVLGLEARMTTRGGWTALMYAAYGGKAEAVTALIPYEAGMVAAEGWTALLLAAHFGHADCARLLAPHEFHLHLSGNMTALDVSHAREHQDCVDAIQEALSMQS